MTFAPSLGARVIRRMPLLYTAGPDPALDRPRHVRAGSGLVRLGPERLALVQDDASFIAIVHPATGCVEAIPLPSGHVRQFDDRRGNKKKKLDLEAAVLLDGGALLVALGSGSSPFRERIALLDLHSEPPVAQLVLANELYAKMRADRRFSGSELNVEGATATGGDVLVFQRGNGAGDACNATARIGERELVAYLHGLGDCPDLRDIARWELGEIDGVRLGFTDAALAPGGQIAFLACAEDSPDATRDGPVTGVAIGRLDDRRGRVELGLVLDEHGGRLLDKCEGLSFSPEDASKAWVVVDKDDPDVPSDLLELRLSDGWRAVGSP